MSKQNKSVLVIQTNENYYWNAQNERINITEFWLMIEDKDGQWHVYNKEKQPQDDIYIFYDEGKSRGVVMDKTGKMKMVKNLLCMWRSQSDFGVRGILLQCDDKDELICLTWRLICSKRKMEDQYINSMVKMFSYDTNTECIQSMEDSLLIGDGKSGKKENIESI